MFWSLYPATVYGSRTCPNGKTIPDGFIALATGSNLHFKNHGGGFDFLAASTECYKPGARLLTVAQSDQASQFTSLFPHTVFTLCHEM